MTHYIKTTFIAILGLAIVFSTPLADKEPSGESNKRQLYDSYFQYKNTPYEYPPYTDRYGFPVRQPIWERFDSFDAACMSLLGGLVDEMPTNKCPVCPATQVVSPVPDTVSFSVTATDCPDATSFALCSRATTAKSGSIDLKFQSSSPGTALLSIVSLVPESKIKVICSSISQNITVSTQSGPLVSGVAKGESGFAFVAAFSRVPLACDTEVRCIWETVI